MEHGERVLVERYRHRGSTTSIKGLWIRNYLYSNPRKTITQVNQEWNRFCDEADELGVHIRRGSYESMRIYFYHLRKKGLVTRELVPNPEKPYPFSYHSLVLEMRDSIAWLNPSL
jgi:hypothetical protein